MEKEEEGGECDVVHRVPEGSSETWDLRSGHMHPYTFPFPIVATGITGNCPMLYLSSLLHTVGKREPVRNRQFIVPYVNPTRIQLAIFNSLFVRFDKFYGYSLNLNQRKIHCFNQ